MRALALVRAERLAAYDALQQAHATWEAATACRDEAERAYRWAVSADDRARCAATARESQQAVWSAFFAAGPLHDTFLVLDAELRSHPEYRREVGA